MKQISVQGLTSQQAEELRCLIKSKGPARAIRILTQAVTAGPGPGKKINRVVWVRISKAAAAELKSVDDCRLLLGMTRSGFLRLGLERLRE